MKLTADTSVIVAAFASWHEHHEPAFAALRRVDVVVAHCLLETYSVLTRMPAPHRMTAAIVSAYLERELGDRPAVALPAAELRELVAECAAEGLAGGSIYDALIAATCRQADLKLLTLDTRARATYGVLKIDHELLA